jgi:hypothetical protein
LGHKKQISNYKEGLMKALLFRATAPAVTLASCLLMFGGVANAQSASITDSGRDSDNSISFKNICDLKVDNDTNVKIDNKNDQSASSGDANVSDNDDVGTVTTGNANNSNSSSFNVSVSNSTGSCLGNSQQPQQGGQGGGGEVSTPVVTPAAAGGMGGEQSATPTAQVTAVPVGGVGAGEGGPAYLAGLTTITLASGAFAVRRLSKSYQNHA